MQRLVEAIAHVRPHMVPIGSSTQFKNELVFGIQRLASVHSAVHIPQAEQTVGDVGRQSRDCAVQRIAGA